jgi:RimJ/RimL family protein N-acetyltransferase
MNLFEGQLVRLAAADVDKDLESAAGWRRDSEYQRLLDGDPAQPWSPSQVRALFDRPIRDTHYTFFIHALADDKVIGFVGLWIEAWNSREAWVGIGLGEREYRGKGYGTEAMRVALRYAFTELNLERVSLITFAYNTRALRSYEKAGFRREGVVRQSVLRDGQRYDDVYMGILRAEWEERDGRQWMVDG